MTRQGRRLVLPLALPRSKPPPDAVVRSRSSPAATPTGSPGRSCTTRPARVAAALQARGVGPGIHVALLGPTTRPLVTAIQAVWLSRRDARGAAAADAPRVDRGVRRRRPARRIAHADVDLARRRPRPRAVPRARSRATRRSSSLRRARRRRRRRRATYERPKRRSRRARRAAVHQRVDGRPQGRDAPAPDHLRQPRRDRGIAARARPRDDVLVSWLPLYHDMGLVGLLHAADDHRHRSRARRAAGLPRRPRRGGWSGCRDFGGTATAGPNFSYVLAARALRNALDGLDLSRWRIALNGAEPVDPDDRRERSSRPPAPVTAAARRGVPRVRHGRGGRSPARSRRRCAGCAPTPSTGACSRPSATPHPSHRCRRRPRGFALLGTPVPGLEIRIVDPETGRPMRDREVGELEIRGTSVTPGYYKRPDADRGDRSTTAGCAPATSRTSSTASWWCAVGSRT